MKLQSLLFLMQSHYQFSARLIQQFLEP